jgi:hypothetical protein
MGPNLGPPMGHEGPKLAQGPLWAQTWAPPWTMRGPNLPRAHYGPKLGPPRGPYGPELAQASLWAQTWAPHEP